MLRFGRIDVTEAQFTIIFVHLVSAVFGSNIWLSKVSIFSLENFHSMKYYIYIQSMKDK